MFPPRNKKEERKKRGRREKYIDKRNEIKMFAEFILEIYNFDMCIYSFASLGSFILIFFFYQIFFWYDNTCDLPQPRQN